MKQLRSQARKPGRGTKPETARAAPRRPRPAPERDRDTEQRILDAAHGVFVRRGTAGARMQEIAAAAGVNQALLHYYFRTKDRLSHAAFERAASQFMPAVIQVLASDEELDAKVAHIVELELDHLARTPYLPGYIISEVTHHPERARQLIAAITGRTPEAVRPQVITMLRRQIDARVRRGTMRAIAPEQFIVNLMSLCVFPFAARPMIAAMLGIDQPGFEQFIARRRHDLPAFFLGALRP
jgi:AcrR family transcriptional regulator